MKGLGLYRRHFIALAAGLVAHALVPGLALAAPGNKTILVLGDSLSAEYGLPRGSGWVALLDARLQSHQPPYKVVNASISGDTTSGGRSRLSKVLALHAPAVVVIELGGNDALRGLPLKETESNLAAMTEAAQMTGAKVLLLGMQVPPNYGADYNTRFSQAFEHVAKARKAALVPFFLQGVADSPDVANLFQNDRIHPKAEAHPLMLETVWPQLKKLLA